MSNKKFILHVAGPTCVGKSTVSKLLSERVPEMYTLSYDKQKLQLSSYDRDRHSELVKSLVFDFFKAISEHGLSVLLDIPFRSPEEYRSYFDYAEKSGYEFISISLVAPREILISRYRERLENSKKTGSRLTINTEELFLKQLEKEFFVPDNAFEFNTSESDLDIIVERIIELIN